MSTFPDASRGGAAAAGDGPGRLNWRVLLDGGLPGATNMARDHALALGVRPGEGTVRFYRWATATLSFGRNEPVTAGYRDLLRRHPEMEAVRRPTGGRAVIHDRELTYCVVLPARAFGGLRLAYRRINQGLLRGLRRLGVDAGGAAGSTAAPDAGPCFLEPAEGEVVVRGRKLVGSAQARIGGAILQHGSLLLVADQSALFAKADAHGAAGNGAEPGRDRGIASAPAPTGNRRGSGTTVAANRTGPPITLAEILGEVPPWEDMVDAFRRGFAEEFGGLWAPGEMTREEMAMVARLERKYGSGEWTWRR
ncbi:MAG: biotin/lipoate A/B protein ligase family protein [Gemmatimonadetes bacterium]|nr:biotin/lipoate A/B protein ligase family protein [Gemmatimonadota bacterium]MCY3676156.1 biotin/lipoate A/B protein ligase family protein [Gemmatimonadota bacterium]MYA42490.1 lipoate--protein ligase family protein [Gemmatimonadota bacterium]MYE95634.1 lipoate--protein ligase family protein [Gemmatimonadota bacterium]MYJ09467.1 lipoate--protein ligase family protein [Gemmatimonadota bacterium]